MKITVGDQLTVEGPKGKQTGPDSSGHYASSRPTEFSSWRAMATINAALHGLTRASTANAVQGVSTGFTRELQIVGIGYKCDVKGRDRDLHAGLLASHRVLSARRRRHEDRQAENNLTLLILTGGDRQLLGQVAANMRALRPPDPYKNKGVRYAGEPLRKKVGKTGRRRCQVACQQKIERSGPYADSSAHPAAECQAAPPRPRLAVFRSVKHIYAQVIDDTVGAHAGRGVVQREDTGVKTAATSLARRPIGKAAGRARQRKGHQGGGVRPRRVSVSRPRQGTSGCARGGRSSDKDLVSVMATTHSKAHRIAITLNLKEQVVSINRVTKVVKGGKNLSFRRWWWSAIPAPRSSASAPAKPRKCPSAIQQGHRSGQEEPAQDATCSRPPFRTRCWDGSAAAWCCLSRRPKAPA